MLALGVLVVPGTASAATGDVGVEGPSHTGTGTPTGTKRATNALWFNDGAWWGNLWDTASSDFHIFRFDAATKSWVDTGVLTDQRSNTHHDVLWDGQTLHVASYRFVNDGLPAEPNYPTTLRRYSYDPVAKTYSLLDSTKINNHRVETLSIDKDSTGRVWATWQQGNRIFLNVTGTDGVTWGTPFAHPHSLSRTSVDDTSAMIAFSGDKVGVMWSRQVGDATDGMYWSYHIDGAPESAWSTPVAAVKGQRSGDDHMNLKWMDSSSGQVFAAIKTSFRSASEPSIQLLALKGTTWSVHTIATVAECPNRVIVMIDETTQRLRTFATYPKPRGTTNAGVCTTSGGAIYEKSTPLNNIRFTTTKTARVVDADQYAHNVTSTKQNLNSAARGTANSGLLLLADVNATKRYWHFYDSQGGSGDPSAREPGTFTPISPTRMLDTRKGSPAGADAAVSFQAAGTGGIPADAAAVVFNLTATEGRSSGYATAYPAGTPRPGTSNVNFAAGQNIPNLVTVPVGAGGKVSIFNRSDTPTHFLADVTGYYRSGTPATAGAFKALAPDRLMDTRTGAPVNPDTAVSFQAAGTNGVPANAAAVVFNLTVTEARAHGYATAYPAGAPRPGTSNLNFPAGRNIPNLVTVPVGADGKVSVFNRSAGTAHFIADIAGYYLPGEPTAAGAFKAIGPTRIMDTRAGAPVGADKTVSFQVAGANAIPAKVSAAVFNLTVTEPRSHGYATAYPSGSTRPGTSNLNFPAGHNIPNLVNIPVGADGKITVFNRSAGTAHYIADIAGYFLP